MSGKISSALEILRICSTLQILWIYWFTRSSIWWGYKVFRKGKTLNSDKILGRLFPRSMTATRSCFYFQLFLLWSFKHIFPFSYQLSNWWTSFCYYFSMFWYNFSIWTFLKITAFRVALSCSSNGSIHMGSDCPDCSLHRTVLERLITELHLF